jgi:hypothetical protein
LKEFSSCISKQLAELHCYHWGPDGDKTGVALIILVQRHDFENDDNDNGKVGGDLF